MTCVELFFHTYNAPVQMTFKTSLPGTCSYDFTANLDLPARLTVLLNEVGFLKSRKSRTKENLAACDIKLTEEEILLIDDIV